MPFATKEQRREHNRKYREEHAAELKLHYAKYWERPENKARRNANLRAAYAKNKEKHKLRKAKAYQENKARFLARNKRWKVANPEKVHEAEMERRRNNVNVRIGIALRSRVKNALRSNAKTGKTLEMLGCAIADFRIYLESKFEPGMTWENYGLHGWHIDHIMPCAIFDLTRAEHQKRCFHFSNMQPLWAFDNLSKADKVKSNQFALL